MSSGGRWAAWLLPAKSTTGEGDCEATPVGAVDADFDFSDFDHREFVSAGVAAGIAVWRRGTVLRAAKLHVNYTAWWSRDWIPTETRVKAAAGPHCAVCTAEEALPPRYQHCQFH